MECFTLMTTDKAYMLVLTELVLLLLMESNVMTKMIEISRLAFRGSTASTVINASSLSQPNSFTTNPNQAIITATNKGNEM